MCDQLTSRYHSIKGLNEYPFEFKYLLLHLFTYLLLPGIGYVRGVNAGPNGGAGGQWAGIC